MNLTLEQIFGVGASQDFSTLIIQKSGLLGINPQENNTPESLLAGIINTVHQQFEGFLSDPVGNAVLDQNRNSIDYDNGTLYDVTGVYVWQVQIQADLISYIFLIFNYSPYAN